MPKGQTPEERIIIDGIVCLSPDSAALKAGVTTRTIYNKMNTGVLGSFRVEKGTFKDKRRTRAVRLDHLIEYIFGY